MRKTLTLLLVLTLLLALALPLQGCQRKVKVKTGEITICTAGEIIKDDTKEIEVPESKVAEYGVTTKVITCDTHNLSKLYDEAQKAIAEGDLATARERLATVVERDPSYRKAKQQLDAIDAGQTPSADNGEEADAGDTGEPPAGDTDTEPPTGPVVSLTKYVPDSIAGYVAQGIAADAASLSRQYLPTGGTSDQMVIEVEQRVNDAQATSQAQDMLSSYPEGQTTKTIGGRTVLAGSSGQFAIAVFTDGPLTVAVELHAKSGSGKDLIGEALAVVEAVTK